MIFVKNPRKYFHLLNDFGEILELIKKLFMDFFLIRISVVGHKSDSIHKTSEGCHLFKKRFTQILMSRGAY